MMRSRRHVNLTVDRLNSMPLFKGCRRRQLELLGYFAYEAVMAPGRVLVRQGELSLECFIVIDGAVEVRVDDRPVASVGANALLGVQSLRDRKRRESSATTTEATR